MPTINPYLNFQDNTEEAFNFYKSIFGGEFSAVQRFKDVGQGPNLPEADGSKLMHIALPVGNNLLMATDMLKSQGQKVNPGNNFSLSVQTESEEEANRIFNGLSAGGKIESPMKKEFWGDYFGMLQDKFGIQWLVHYTYPK